MTKAKRKIEIFSAGCSVCEETIAMINQAAYPSCEVEVLDMNEPRFAERARRQGIRSVPAVLIEGQIASCCSGQGPDEATLRTLGLGQTR